MIFEIVMVVFVSVLGLLAAFCLGWDFASGEAGDEVTFATIVMAASSCFFPAYMHYAGSAPDILPWIHSGGIVASMALGAWLSRRHQKRLGSTFQYFPQY